MDVDNYFDQWLHDELGFELSRAAGTVTSPPEPRYAMQGRQRHRLRIAGLVMIPLGLSVRTAAALAAALVATGGGAAIVVTSHVLPGSSGQHTVQLATTTSSPSSNHGSAVTSAV